MDDSSSLPIYGTWWDESERKSGEIPRRSQDGLMLSGRSVLTPTFVTGGLVRPSVRPRTRVQTVSDPSTV